MTLFARVMEELKSRGLSDILVLAGGIIPDEDQTELKEMGISAVFGPGSSTQDMIKFINQNVVVYA